MVVTCEKCGRVYDDAARWTICPHRNLGEPAGSDPLPAVPEGATRVSQDLTQSEVSGLRSEAAARDQELKVADERIVGPGPHSVTASPEWLAQDMFRLARSSGSKEEVDGWCTMFVGYLDQMFEKGKGERAPGSWADMAEARRILKQTGREEMGRDALRRVEVVNGSMQCGPQYLKGWFHRWADAAGSQCCGGPPGATVTMALVEFEDGEVRMVSPGWVRFVVEKARAPEGSGGVAGAAVPAV